MAAPTADFKATKRVIKDGKLARRSMGFWCQFNCWYRTFWEAEGRRPSVIEVKKWYDEAADSCWGEMKPTWDETRTHSKCLRSLDQVRSYFRQYRAAKKQETSDVSKADASRPLGMGASTQQQSWQLATMSCGNHQDDTGIDAAFFRAAKIRRPSADIGGHDGSQLGRHTSGGLTAVSLDSPGSELCGSVQDRTAFAHLTSAAGIAAFACAAVQAMAVAGPVSAKPYVDASTRTISTGALRRDLGQTTACGAVQEQAAAREAQPSTEAGAFQGVVTTLGWGHKPADSFVATSLQLQASQREQQQQPQVSNSASLQLAQGSYLPSGSYPQGPASCAAPPLPSSLLHSSRNDTESGASPQRTDRPPRPPSTAAPHAVVASSQPAPMASVPRPVGGMGPGTSDAARDSTGTCLDPAALSDAGAAIIPANSAAADHQQSRAGNNRTLRPAQVTTGCGQQQPQQRLVQTAFSAAAAHAHSMDTSAYSLHHGPAAHPHHPVMHMGYDPVYGHPAYMDPYAYSYGMHDPGAAYWRMYPYCYPAPQHAMHAIYSELPLHMPDFRESCYGSMGNLGAGESGPQASLPQQPSAIGGGNGTGLAYYGSALHHSTGAGKASYEYARSNPMPQSQQHDAAAYLSRSNSSKAPAPPVPAAVEGPKAQPTVKVESSKLPNPACTDVSVASVSVSMGTLITSGDAAACGNGCAPQKHLQASKQTQPRPVEDPARRECANRDLANGPRLAAGEVHERLLMSGESASSEVAAGDGRSAGCATDDPATSLHPRAPVGPVPAGAAGARQEAQEPSSGLERCDVVAIVHVPLGGSASKAAAEIELSPMPASAGFGAEFGLGLDFCSPGIFFSGATPRHDPVSLQKQQACGLLADTPASRKWGNDVFAPAITPGAPSLLSGLDLLPLPDLLALGPDLDMDCTLFLSSPSAVAL